MATMAIADWLLVATLSLFLVTLCVVRSRTRLLWADELYVHRMVTHPSLLGMLRGWWNGMDGGGGLYYVLVRWWSQLFGYTELPLRLYSTFGMCIALAATWAAARRYFATPVVALAVGLTYLTPATMLWQELNGRFYGQFLAFAAVACLWFLHTADRDPTRTDLGVTALAHAGLIGSHILGMVYSFTLLTAMIVLDRLHRRCRPKLYLAAAAGWVTLLLTLHAVVASAAVAKNHFWTQKPSLADLFTGIALQGRLTFLLLAPLLLAATARVALSAPLRRELPTQLRSNAAPVALSAALVAAQLILFLKSQTGTSIYVDRYLMPVSIATVFLFAAAFRVLLPRDLVTSTTPLRTVALSLAALAPCAAFAVSRNINHALYPPLGYTQQVAARMPPGQPVLVTLPNYTLFTSYDLTHTYLFMLDWPYDLSPAQSAVDYSGEHLMENWKGGGFDADHILPCPELFTRYPDLTLLLDFHRTDWFHDRLEHNPAYQVQPIATFTRWYPMTLYNIHRIGSGPLPC